MRVRRRGTLSSLVAVTVLLSLPVASASQEPATPSRQPASGCLAGPITFGPAAAILSMPVTALTASRASHKIPDDSFLALHNGLTVRL